MFKNSYYNKNKNIITIPKHVDKHDIKSDIKPNVNKSNNYENIRNTVENNESDVGSKASNLNKSSAFVNKILNSDKKDIKNKLNIV